MEEDLINASKRWRNPRFKVVSTEKCSLTTSTVLCQLHLHLQSCNSHSICQTTYFFHSDSYDVTVFFDKDQQNSCFPVRY
ncbi:hypothetical protein QVD17_39218 [Tagetes erecta]|uniref:Uncharacterized protein n=1 Tax=Tagetes erecta TaxID=13708 RepID=A0AAD8NGW5_TARER|nr:hypothetical protein QVD17_39218 [Tagetes erecta]